MYVVIQDLGYVRSLTRKKWPKNSRTKISNTLALRSSVEDERRLLLRDPDVIMIVDGKIIALELMLII
jgi:hypothetical protein